MASTAKDIQASLVHIPFILKSYIQENIKPISAKYSYPNERGINPAFQSLAEVKSRLQLNEKRIFVLRSDFIIATGVKNAYQEYHYHGLEDVIDPALHQYIDWTDRYGHPSLTQPDVKYNGQVYYAGFVCQRRDHLEVFLSSGRFNRSDRVEEGIFPLSEEQTHLIESYLVLNFSKSYGEQDVVFYDTQPGKQDDEDSALFFTDTPFPVVKQYRRYSQESLAKAAACAEAALNYAKARKYIRLNIAPVKPKYSYPGEDNINPAFENIEQVSYPLQHLEKRIWVLRSDFLLATGVKNAYEKEYNYRGIADTFSEASFKFINWDDRYGHPSLTIPEGNYDGSAFYAGYLCQRKGYLQVYLASGRFDRNDLDENQVAILEAYIAAQFQTAYGQQEIVFDYANPDNSYYHTTFFGHGIFSKDNPQRRYDAAKIREILTNIPAKESIKEISQTSHCNIILR
ncbi:hypothetical protein HRQ65_07305 [Tatlockia micdadei]|uniref:hypothetical protein n=1 Tax=Legionella micdadei TaxID=451 RepID=UPI00156E1696|nr:hypothetical protein [Legionella micdadei]NSL18187.1 hypothetical protein [Legionella micdadei]